jgi:hypothetical protein
MPYLCNYTLNCNSKKVLGNHALNLYVRWNKGVFPFYILQDSFELKFPVIWDVILCQMVNTRYSFSKECRPYIFMVRQSKKSGLHDAWDLVLCSVKMSVPFTSQISINTAVWMSNFTWFWLFPCRYFIFNVHHLFQSINGDVLFLI